jgi:hypothetical protein
MDENQVELSEREKELIDKLAMRDQDVANVTAELIELRKKREPQEVKETPVAPVVADPRETVLSVLAEKEQEQVKANLEAAKLEFKRTVRELSPDVDQGGLLSNKFEAELSKFNLSGLKTKEEFMARMGEAYRLMSIPKPAESKVNLYNGVTAPGADVPLANDGSLGALEMKIIQEIGWTKEKYLAEKAKRPHYVASLLKYRS